MSSRLLMWKFDVILCTLAAKMHFKLHTKLPSDYLLSFIVMFSSFSDLSLLLASQWGLSIERSVKKKFTRQKGSEQVQYPVNVLTFTGAERASSLLSSSSWFAQTWATTPFLRLGPSLTNLKLFSHHVKMLNNWGKSSGVTGKFRKWLILVLKDHSDF